MHKKIASSQGLQNPKKQIICLYYVYFLQKNQGGIYMPGHIQLIKQYLTAEKAMLTDLALDVANAENEHDFKKAKVAYNA